MKKLRVALLAGGISTERSISLKTAAQIKKNLDPQKYQIKIFDPKFDLGKFVRNKSRIDIAFIALHGRFGEDGTIQGMLELLNIPYTGSDVLSSSLAMDKIFCKKLFKDTNIPIPKHIIIENRSEIKEKIKKVKIPCIVKPNKEGSSYGITVVRKKKDLEKAVKMAYRYDSQIIIEDYIKGREITVSVLGNNKPIALPVIEICPTESEYFDFKAKYEKGACDEICPAEIDLKLAKTAKNLGRKAHFALKCRSMSRTDMIIREKDKKIFVLEINTIPGMTETSLLPQAAAAAGISFPELLDEIIRYSLEK